MKFYVDKLPKSCQSCPLNYDGISCKLHKMAWFEMDEADLKEYKACLDGNKKRYSKCRLILLQDTQKENRAK